MSRTAEYHYRAELPRVVETVHHRNALEALGKRGIQLSDDTSWQEICTQSDWSEGEYRLTQISYMGRVSVGHIFGQNNWRLHYSKPTPQGKILADEAGDLKLLHKHTRIHLGHGTEGFAEIMMIPDSPPVVMRVEAINHVLWDAKDTAPTTNDSHIIEAVRRLEKINGKLTWEYVDEATAQNLVFALENDMSFSQYA